MKEIPLTQGQTAFVDDEDYEELSKYKWHAATVKGRHKRIYYATRWYINDNGVESTIAMHQQIIGKLRPYARIAHKDLNGLNNQRENLLIMGSEVKIIHDEVVVITANKTQSYFSLCDYNTISTHNWSTSNGYLVTHVMSKNNERICMAAHLLIMSAEPHQPGQQVDHINRNKLDNRRSNLRWTDKSMQQHNKNKSKTHDQKPTSSRFKGVSFNKKKQKWCVVLTINCRCVYLGEFALEEDAARAYDEAAALYYGANAATNHSLGMFNQ